MPLARIRSFDPEAIAFLAAQLAESGYTLQFVRPDETGLEEADLELTVVRRDLEEALLTARAEAERLGVAVMVMPGVMPVEAPEAVVMNEPVVVSEFTQTPEPVLQDAEIPEVVPVEVEQIPTPQIPAIVAREIPEHLEREKPQWVRLTQESSEKTAHLLGRSIGRAVDGLEVISDSARRGFESGKQGLAEMGDATARRFGEWKTQLLRTQTVRREAPKPELFEPSLARQKTFRRPKPLWLRERIYRWAAIAAVLVVAAIIGWTLAGHAGPANPVGKGTGLSTVQEQVPFGPASTTAPVAAIVPAHVSQKAKPQPAATPSNPAEATNTNGDDFQEVVVRHFNQKPAAVQAKSKPSHTNDNDFQEVVVRHFNQKPKAIQAKSKSHDTVTRDGVKIISEE